MFDENEAALFTPEAGPESWKLQIRPCGLEIVYAYDLFCASCLIIYLCFKNKIYEFKFQLSLSFLPK